MPPSAQSLAPQGNLLTYPMNEFYAASGIPMPRIEQIDGEQMPEPYRQLLVHEGDMTPTLEAYHGVTIHLRVLSRNEHEGALFREVALVRDDDERPVEFGAIRINLDHFPDAAREEILGCHVPLGTILARHHIKHGSRPSAYLRVISDSLINDAFSLDAPTVLWGRQNALRNSADELLAEVIEILPPMEA